MDRDDGTSHQMNKDDVTSVQWSLLGTTAHLRVMLKSDGKALRFEGFKKQDKTNLKEFLSETCGVDLEDLAVSCSGENYGDVVLEDAGEEFSMEVGGDGKSGFTIPFEDIAQCVNPMRNEVEIHLHEADTVAGDHETVSQLRLYVPPGDAAADAESPAQSLFSRILDRAKVDKVTGEALCTFPETVGTFLQPYGRYRIEMYQSFLRLYGKTYEYKVMYKSINRLFLLEKPDQQHVAFVISLEDPVRQGNQRFSHLVAVRAGGSGAPRGRVASSNSRPMEAAGLSTDKKTYSPGSIPT